MVQAGSHLNSKPANLVQAIERAAALLDILGRHSHGISLRELSAQADIPKGTTHRLLGSLAFFGYVQQDPKTRNYSLGFKLLELSNRVLHQLDFREQARPLLMELAEKTSETVHLVVMDKFEILYVDKLEPLDLSGLRMASRIGSRTSAHSSAVGKVLLSVLPEHGLEEFIRKAGLPRKTANTITDPGQLKQHLQTVRSQGYAIDDEENETGVRCVAAPIRNQSGRVIAAASISGPATRISKKHLRGALRDEIIRAGDTISWRLGFRQ